MVVHSPLFDNVIEDLAQEWNWDVNLMKYARAARTLPQEELGHQRVDIFYLKMSPSFMQLVGWVEERNPTTSAIPIIMPIRQHHKSKSLIERIASDDIIDAAYAWVWRKQRDRGRYLIF